MSQDKDATIICPNCGAEAKGNFCAECGQPTHLHKETFWGLIVHFVAHYFHYDSKFLQTMKTLITRPGELTRAYWEKKRASFIQPISLYIFVSTVFFIINFFSFHRQVEKLQTGEIKHKMDSVMYSNAIDTTLSAQTAERQKEVLAGFSGESEKLYDMVEETLHDVPKILFFMVPFMALILKLLFVRRKDVFYVDHAVFSLHVHTFFFIFLLAIGIMSYAIPKTIWLSMIYSFIVVAGSVVYMVLSLHKAYNLHPGKSILMTILMIPLYSIIFMTLLIAFGYQHGVDAGLWKAVNWSEVAGR